jgi:cobalamin biosynthesis protein CobT
MSETRKPTHTQPGGFVEEDERAEDGVVNDSLGTTSIADSTGTDEDRETGDAKDGNENTRED